MPRLSPTPERRCVALAVALVATVLALPVRAGEIEPLDLLRDYVRVPTVEGAGRDAAAADLLARTLRAAGIATELHVTRAGHAQLSAFLPATAPASPTVVLLHHLDVVPPGEGWSGDPFSGRVADGALWGRGAIDAKSLGVAHLASFLAAAALPERRRGLLYLAVSDEENGGIDGTRWLLERRPDLFEHVDAVLNEGGANRTVLGRTVYFGVETEQKRPLWLEATARGRPGHAAALAPDSAAHRLIRALARLVDRPPVWKVDPAARRYFAALGRWDPNVRRLAERMDDVILPAGPTVSLQPGQPIFFLDTLQVTTLAAADRVNVVSEVASARIDVRLLPSTDAEEYLAGIRETLGPDIDVRVLLESPAAGPSPVEGPFWVELARGLDGEAPVIPLFLPGITDSRYFRARGIAAYGVSPFEIEGEIARTVHGPDERIPVEVFERGVEKMKKLVRALVAAPPTEAS